MYIRKATPEDVDQIAAVEAACFPEAEAASAERLSGRLAVYPEGFWLGFDDFRNLICYAAGPVTREEDLLDEMYADPACHNAGGDWQMIFSVCTLPDYQRQGLAAWLLQRVIRESVSRGRKGVVLTCKEGMLPYYAKFGFVSEGVSSSVHGGSVWYQMRLIFDDEYFYEHAFDVSDNPEDNIDMLEESFWGMQV